ncbi:MAG TPA: bifunctional ADP-heptose synthase [bacterium]|nr:bifunctional ADP-heptose synthase [bacterium]
MRSTRFKSIVNKMRGRRIAVLGDLMVDEYIFGESSRISREAPVLILDYRMRHVGFGGASNAVANIAALGGVPIPVGCIGDDDNGKSLIELFNQQNVDTSGVIIKSGIATVCKTRILAGGMHTLRQQIVRIDREPEVPPDPDEVLEKAEEIFKRADAVLVSDYGCGTLSKKTISYINGIAKNGKIVAIDSRFQLHRFKNASLAAPNEEEAGIHAGHGADDIDNIEKMGETLRKKLKSRGLLITRGSEGISLFEDGSKPYHVPVFGSKVAVDNTGAGDTVVSAALLSLCAGADYREAVQIANRAGGLVVMKKGAATVSPEELISTI